MFNKNYKQMTVREAIDALSTMKGEGTDESFVAHMTALMPFLPREADKRMKEFSAEWNYNHPYEYYQSEALNLVRTLVEENIGKPVSFFGRLLGKRVLQWDTIIKVQEC